jgi:hypothetical protein
MLLRWNISDGKQDFFTGRDKHYAPVRLFLEALIKLTGSAKPVSFLPAGGVEYQPLIFIIPKL